MSQRIHILILAGGWSDERDISIQSGRTVLAALPRSRYRATLSIIKTTDTPAAVASRIRRSKPDIVYNALHGAFGEDGCVQTLLDSLHIPYTGSGVAASKTGIDKHLTNTIAKKLRLHIPRSQFVAHSRTGIITPQLRVPVVVKPNASGSSVGVSIIDTQSNIMPAIRRIIRSGSDCLVQERIVGREFSCAVLTGGSKKDIVFPVIEIITEHPFFDYTAKYHSKTTKEICPAKIPSKLQSTIQRAALRIHRALGCSGLTRSDFIVDARGSVFFLEINTSPGMTKQSLCPKAAKAYGWSFTRLIEEQVARASD